jgi:hypothetical protein
MDWMKESVIEKRLVAGLTAHGFKVLKLTCPGTNGVPDRMILRPVWSPGAPMYIELKAPKQHERRLQEIIRDEWRKRGLIVLDFINSIEAVDILIGVLLSIANDERPKLADLI